MGRLVCRHRRRGDQGTGAAKHDASRAEAKAVSDDEPENLCRRSADGHADADLGDALADDRREHTVEADSDEHGGGRGEDRDELRLGSLSAWLNVRPATSGVRIVSKYPGRTICQSTA